MLSLEEKRQLEHRFFLDDSMPDKLGTEELEYLDTLSNQWNQSLMSLYRKIKQQDKCASDLKTE